MLSSPMIESIRSPGRPRPRANALKRIAPALVCCALAAAVVLSAEPATPAASPDDPLLEALELELVRSWDGLREIPGPPLYFLGYEARDTTEYSLSAELGAIVFESTQRDRYVDVDVRVGTPALDNTHQMKGQGGRSELPTVRGTDLAIDDDVDALRADIWERTDRSFKDAHDRYANIETNVAVTADDEDLSPDFSPAEAQSSYEPIAHPEIDRDRWHRVARELSTAIKRHAFVLESSVSFDVDSENRYIVNSEGTRVVTGGVLVRLAFEMQSQTEDGMHLQRGRAYDAATPAELPSLEAMLADVENAAAELEALLQAPLVDPYTGPAIFRHRATGVFFHEILGHRLEGHRQKLETEGQTFTKMVGMPVVADFISVHDDPTIRSHDGQFLRGFYRFDNEGVPAERTTLVEHGILKGFLMSRSPIAGFGRSNGHGRRSAGRFTVARMGNTLVSASRTVSYERLREMLIEEMRRQEKPYGLIFDDISGGFTTTGRGGTQSFKVIPHLVYRVYADGRADEVVRGVDMVGTPLTSFGKILAAADDDSVFNGSCGAESGWVPVSAVAPSILVSEIEIEKRAKSSDKPPILTAPPSARSEP